MCGMYVLWRALFWLGGVRKKNILLYNTMVLNLSFASLHKKMLVSFCMVWFIFSPVCAFLKTHFFQDDVAITWLSSWWCIKVCVWIIFMTCKCCTYIVMICIHVPFATLFQILWHFILFCQGRRCDSLAVLIVKPKQA